MTTTSCSGRMAPPDPTSMPYRWVLTTTTSAAAARRLRRLREAGLAERAALGARALLAGDADRGPRPVAGVPVQLGAVARGGRGRPGRQALDLVPVRREQVLQLQLAGPRVAHLPHALEAQVVAAPLQDRPGELDVELLGQERQVLGGQLVLQGLRGGGDDRGAARQDGRDEVGEGLARPRARLDDEVPAADDGLGDGLRHVGLAGAWLAVGERGGDEAEGADGLRAGRRRVTAALTTTARAPRAAVPVSTHRPQPNRGVHRSSGTHPGRTAGGNVPPWVTAPTTSGIRSPARPRCPRASTCGASRATSPA